MIQLKLRQGEKRITTNAMVDSGETEDFIDRQFCIQYQFPVRRLNQPWDIFRHRRKIQLSRTNNP